MNRIISCAALLTTLVVVTAAPAKQAWAQEVADQFDCQACHLERVRELKRPRGALLIDAASISQGEHGEQPPASTSRMCLSCHDGFVEDARYVWSDKHSTHPVGVVLPEGMAMKTIDDVPVFPLNEDGEVYCGTCHIAHLGEGAAAKADPFLRVDSEKGDNCSNCHADNTTVAGSPHASVRARRQPPDFATRGICGGCHAPHENYAPLLWAKEPGEGNVPANTLCNACHQGVPSPAEHPATVLAWSPANRALIGADNGSEMPVFDENVHEADRGRIGCPTCHDPHQHRAEGRPEDAPALFLRLAAPEGMLCGDCHASEALFRYQFFHSQKSRGR